jgi:Tfp pilus assembly protein FimT
MEILIAVAVILILAGIATPFLLGSLQGYRLRTAAWELAGNLRLARQRAVTAQQRTRLVASPSGAAQQPNTYVLEREEGGVSAGIWRDDGPRFRLPPGVTLAPASAATVTFTVKGAADPGTVILANARGEYRVVVNVVGRVTVCQGAC